MSVSSTLARGRRAAERLMVDTCRVTRPGEGERVYDEDTMQYTDPERETVYEGKCQIQDSAEIAGASNSVAGEQVTSVQPTVLKLPIVGSEEIAVGDVAEILTAPHDVALVGRELTVVARHAKTNATSRRLRVEEGNG